MSAKRLESLTPRVSEHLLRVPFLGKLIDGYLITLRSEGKSPKTISYHSGILGNFLWYCQERNLPQDIEHITTPHIRQFLVYVQKEPVRWGGRSPSSRRPASQTTLQHYYKSLHVFFSWLVSESLVAFSPLDGIKKPRASEKVVQPLGQEEVKRLLDLCDTKSFLGLRNRAIIMLFLDTGLRLSELADLRVSDIDFERGTIMVRKGKGRKQRVLHLGNRCQRALWRWLTLCHDGESDALFASQDGQSLQARGVKIMVRRLCKEAGITGGMAAIDSDIPLPLSSSEQVAT